MLALVVGAFSFLVGFTNVFAATLVQTPVDDYFYTRRGGGKPYMSAQWNLYDMDGKAVDTKTGILDHKRWNYIVRCIDKWINRKNGLCFRSN